jgi:hypothetical protein
MLAAVFAGIRGTRPRMNDVRYNGLALQLEGTVLSFYMLSSNEAATLGMAE